MNTSQQRNADRLSRLKAMQAARQGKSEYAGSMEPIRTEIAKLEALLAG